MRIKITTTWDIPEVEFDQWIETMNAINDMPSFWLGLHENGSAESDYTPADYRITNIKGEVVRQ